ncbi:MAG: HAMP domain-containing histidine kinase [Ruminococcaceae bacterium]|nr:HAMP domain-containing histidine kinase [Oscillospiraceae bacterium]
MFKSVFSRFIIAFTLIFVISFSFLIVIIRVLVKDYSAQVTTSRFENAEIAVNSAKNMIDGLYSEYYADMDTDDPNNEINFETYLNSERGKLENALSGYAIYSDLVILVTDHKGIIHLTSDAQGKYKDIQFKRIPVRSRNEILLEGRYSEMGDLGGLLDAEYDTIALRLATDPAGTVFVCIPHDDLGTVYQDIVKTTVIVGFLVMAAGVIVIIFLSEQIRSPLRSMERAARSFAKGDFTVRVPETGGGEIAELAVVFNNMAASLAELEEQRSSFLANVSHDLRTPMTTISGFIDGILDGVIPEEKHPYYLAIVREEVGRLSRLVRTLLELSRIQAGDRKFTFTPMDVHKMAWQILVSNEKRINDKKLDVDFDADDDAMYVLADSDAIHQVLYNLIDNAIKFAKDEGVLRIQLKNEGGKVRVTIYNEGHGVSQEELPHLFDRFYKADKSRGLDKAGTGLGLNIARVIIVAHGDDIKAESEEGKYCSFTFCLKKTTKEQYLQEHGQDSDLEI